MKKNFIITLAFLIMLFIFVGGCVGGKKAPTSQQTTEQTKEEKTSEVNLTAKEAYKKLVIEAHNWQSDAQAYKLSDGSERGNIKITEDGKSTNWMFWFASPSKKEMWVFTFRNGEPYHYPEGGKGSLSYDTPDWSNDWQIDSDKAVQIAKEAGSGKITGAKMYLRGSSFVTVARQVPESTKVWWEIYGENKKIYIDATTGTVLGSED